MLMKTKNRLLVKACIDEINPQIEVLSQLFYKELFHLDNSLRNIFYGNVMFLNKKFINLLATLKNVKHLEAISSSLMKMGERHAANYGAEIRHFPVLKQALLLALHQHLGERFTTELEAAWHDVFDDVSAIMMQVMSNIESTQSVINQDESNYGANLFDEIGSEDIILRVHQRFYDAIFEEPWLEKFFYGKSKETLIRKQTQFMVAAFNGPNNYTGDTPAFVHMHMLITEEMSNVRETLLRRAILAEGLSTAIADRWLAVDRSFRPAIVKKSVDECVLKCVGQMPIVAEKPRNYVAPE
jgi:hemoglobin-like flavoprotein/truncated hemoglobin YjbI